MVFYQPRLRNTYLKLTRRTVSTRHAEGHCPTFQGALEEIEAVVSVKQAQLYIEVGMYIVHRVLTSVFLQLVAVVVVESHILNDSDKLP